MRRGEGLEADAQRALELESLAEVDIDEISKLK
jgi:hypothetical protein